MTPFPAKGAAMLLTINLRYKSSLGLQAHFYQISSIHKRSVIRVDSRRTSCLQIYECQLSRSKPLGSAPCSAPIANQTTTGPIYHVGRVQRCPGQTLPLQSFSADVNYMHQRTSRAIRWVQFVDMPSWHNLTSVQRSAHFVRCTSLVQSLPVFFCRI